MKRTQLFSFACLAGLLLTAATCRAQEEPRQLGLGVYAGTPFGFSAKYNIDGRNSVATGLGVQGDSFDMHVDVLTHFRDLNLQPPVGRLAPYLGLGMKIKDESDTLFGFRFLGGLSYVFKGAPLEVFGELAPVLRVTPSLGSNLDGGAGIRYYFGGSR